jgi:M-phase inducer tyrosine phosphatase
MFQHPDDVMREEQDTFDTPSSLASVMDVDQQDQGCMLPHFVSSEDPDGLPRISHDTLIDVLENKYADKYDAVKIIDCRFEYEFNGGHIENAVNFCDKQQLVNELFSAESSTSALLIFHCEYSVHRAPLTAKFIRAHDRNVNVANYPKLTYPEIYILDGGYSSFFKAHRSRCFPQDYVEMNDQRHEQACERGLARVKGRQKLFRAQTYAFGQNGHDDMEDESPTAQGRSMGPRTHSAFSVGEDVATGMGNSYARRMASY